MSANARVTAPLGGVASRVSNRPARQLVAQKRMARRDALSPGRQEHCGDSSLAVLTSSHWRDTDPAIRWRTQHAKWIEMDLTTMVAASGLAAYAAIAMSYVAPHLGLYRTHQ